MIKPLLFLFFLLPLSHLWAAATGEQLYTEHCAVCHGGDGNGGVGVPLSLESFLQSVSDDYLEQTIRLGRPGRVMPAFQDLDDQQIGAIVAYIRAWSDKKAPVFSKQPIQGDPGKGKPLYQQYCASCHGSDAGGGMGTGVTFSRPRDHEIIAPALSNQAFLASASDEMIKQTLRDGRKGTPMTSFLKQGLTDKQLDHLVAYIRSFQGRQDSHASDKKLAPYLRYESEENMEVTLAALKRAAVGANFRVIREQTLDYGFVKKENENQKKRILYFCNFNMLNKALAIDPRVGLFLPCRVTLIERDNKVSMITVNPAAMSRKFNNAELDKICEQMSALYQEILEEAAL